MWLQTVWSMCKQDNCHPQFACSGFSNDNNSSITSIQTSSCSSSEQTAWTATAWKEESVCWCRFKSFSWRRSQPNAANLTSATGWRAARLIVERSACCAVEELLCRSDEDSVRVCAFRRSHWAPTCYSLLLSLFLFDTFVILCFFSSLFIFLPPVPSPSSTPSLPCPVPLSSHARCISHQQRRHSAFRPSSSQWQSQLPDKRKQIPQQEPDINGLSLVFFTLPVCSLSLFPHTEKQTILLCFNVL